MNVSGAEVGAMVVFIIVVAIVVIGALLGVRRLIEGGNRCVECRMRIPRDATRCGHCGVAQ